MPITTTMKRTVAAVGVAALLTPAGVIAIADASTTATIKLKGVQFTPRTATVKKGNAVKFLWAGGTHNLIGPGVKVGAKDSGSRVVTFKKRGTFKFVCTLHANMTAKVIVK